MVSTPHLGGLQVQQSKVIRGIAIGALWSELLRWGLDCEAMARGIISLVLDTS